MILDLHRQGLSITAIARRTGRDPKTVRKYIERGLEPPAYGPRQVGRPSKLAPRRDDGRHADDVLLFDIGVPERKFEGSQQFTMDPDAAGEEEPLRNRKHVFARASVPSVGGAADCQATRIADKGGGRAAWPGRRGDQEDNKTQTVTWPRRQPQRCRRRHPAALRRRCSRCHRSACRRR